MSTGKGPESTGPKKRATTDPAPSSRENSPQFSIITPVYNPRYRDFLKCAKSVRKQSFQDWEWCIVDDGSTKRLIWPIIRILASFNRRISARRRDTNGGISVTSNDALSLANGRFIVPLDHDDRLKKRALQLVSEAVERSPEAQFLYSDEEVINGRGRLLKYLQKPEWSPERLLCQNYCNHLSVFDRALVQQVGGYREEYDGAQDHDLVLRVTELASSVVHIAAPLYQWRAIPGSTATAVTEKPGAVDAGRRVIEDAVRRRKINGEVIAAGEMFHRVKRFPSSSPKVSIIIPTRGTAGTIFGLQMPFVKNLLMALSRHRTYPDLEVLVVSDTETPSDAIPRTLANLDVSTIPFPHPFNFAAKCNLGAVKASGEVLIFLNDDIEPVSEDWIQTLVAHLEHEDSGIVGPMLVYENGLVQSAGHINPGPVIFGRGESPLSKHGYGMPLWINRETSGLTGACVAMRRTTFYEIGGFSELFPNNYNDVDLCYKLQLAGYRCLWTPDATLYHFESKSRETPIEDWERDLASKYWGRFITTGPDSHTT